MKTGSVYKIEDGILYECIGFEEEGAVTTIVIEIGPVND